MTVMAFRISSMLVVCAALAGASSAAAGVADDLAKEARHVPRDGPKALDLARRLRRSGMYDESVRVARTALASARGASLVGDLFLEVARNRIAQRNQRAADRECARLEKLDDVKQQVCIAEAQLLRRRGSLALPAAEAALAKNPRSYDALVAKGRALAQVGQPDAAESTLRAAADRDPARLEARRALAQLLVDRGKSAAALAVLRDAMRVDPTHPDVLLMIGQHATDAGEAVAALRGAVVSRPSEAVAHALLGKRLLEQRDLGGARVALERALQLDPKQAGWHADLGDLHLAEGDPDGALASARAASKIVANHPHAKLVEANALAAKGDIDLAIVAFEAASGLARRDPKPLVDAAKACVEHGRPTTARAFADRATEEFPTWGPAWVAQGDAALAGGDRAGARAAYAKALRSKGPVDQAAVKKKLSALK